MYCAMNIRQMFAVKYSLSYSGSQYGGSPDRFRAEFGVSRGEMDRRYCTSLHCTAKHCTELHCTALHCIALQFTALNCAVLS